MAARKSPFPKADLLEKDAIMLEPTPSNPQRSLANIEAYAVTTGNTGEDGD